MNQQSILLSSFELYFLQKQDCCKSDELHCNLFGNVVPQPCYSVDNCKLKASTRSCFCSKPPSKLCCKQFLGPKRPYLFKYMLQQLLLNISSFSQYYIRNFDTLKSKFRRKNSSTFLADVFIFVLAFCFCFTSAYAYRDGQPPRAAANNMVKMSRYRGETVSLVCSVAGNPRPEIVWLKDNEQISRDWKRFRRIGNRLRIRKSEVADSGLYQCQAVNGFGSGQMMLIQLEIIDQTSSGHSRKKGTIKPIFTQPVKMRRHSYIKPQGGTVSFRCKAKGKPRPRIQWFKDGNRTEMKGVSGSVQWILTLRNIDARDSGRYTCRVWNSAGEISFDYTLRVVGSQHERPVLLKPHPVNTTVEVGGRASLQCRVRSELPPTVKWIKRLSPESLRSYTGQLPNNTLQIDGNYYLFLPSQEMVVLPDGSYLNKLVISRARLADSGIYICLGANTMGYTFRFAYLTVNPMNGELQYTGGLSSEKEQLPLAAVIGVPAAVGVLIVCIITMYCANNRDRFARWSKTQQIAQRERTKTHYEGASRLSSSSSTSTGNVEVVMDSHAVAKSRLSRSGLDFTLASARSEDAVQKTISVNPYRDKVASDYTESEFASNYAPPPPPPPPSQHSRSSWSSTKYSRSHHSCNHHRYHEVPRRDPSVPSRNNSLRGSQCSHHHHEHHSLAKC